MLRLARARRVGLRLQVQRGAACGRQHGAQVGVVGAEGRDQLGVVPGAGGDAGGGRGSRHGCCC